MKAYYFGCDVGPNHGGHHFYTPGMRSVRGHYEQMRDHLGFGKIDGGLAPELKDHQAQGVAALHHNGKWTALAFWDRTGDSRGGSNSVFFFEGTVSFERAVELARKLFPEVTDRLTFEIQPVKRYPTRDEALAAASDELGLAAAPVVAAFERALTTLQPQGPVSS